MIIDAHLHCTGRETTADVLRSLDEARIDRGVLLAPFLNDGYTLDDAASLRRANAHLAQLVRGHGDRLTGFAVVNPSQPGAADDLRHAVEGLGLRGVKMVPAGWYPYDAHVQPTFAVAAELRLPMLFHSGIFIDGRSGRFCRPSFFEVLRDHPGVRVALAHLGWPWTDEAIAVALIDRIHGVPPAQAMFRCDISFGPPPPYRLEVLRRALEVLGPDCLQFGSDCFLPCSGRHIAERMGWVAELMDQLGLDTAARNAMWNGTAAAWLGLPGAAPDTPTLGTDDLAALQQPSPATEGPATAPAMSRRASAAGSAPTASPPVRLPGPHRPHHSLGGWLGGGGTLAPFCC